jgi:hypothetical protein
MTAMEVIRIGAPELIRRVSIRKLAGLLPSEKIRELQRMTPLEQEKALAQWAKELLEKNIQTQTALKRALAEEVRKATEEAKKAEIPVEQQRKVTIAMERARARLGGIVGPTGEERVIIQLPASIKRELNELARVMERYAKMAVPAEIRTEIRVYSRAADDLRSRVAKIRGLAGQLGIDPNLPEIALPLQQAEFMAADFERRVEQRRRFLEERGQTITVI